MNKLEEKRRLTPLMGWASWNCFRTNISEDVLKKQADLLINTGLASHGYTYFNVDDGFFGGRTEEGKLKFHEKRFPNGIRVISDYAHSKGLKAGIYTEAGDNTCGYYYDNEAENGRNSGSYHHEESDLRQLLVENNFDFIKIDWCGGLRLGLDEQEQYSKLAAIIRQIEVEENRPIVFNVCRWEFPGAWVADIADSWRTGVDILPNFDSVLYQIDQMKSLRKFCSPGHINDSDMMQVGNGMSHEEDVSHFAMWCMLSTPLMLGCDLTTLTKDTLDIITNDELIAINQDKLCNQAYVCKEYLDDNKELVGEIWIKDLVDGSRAVAVLNRSSHDFTVQNILKEAGISKITSIRNLISHEDVKESNLDCIEVPSHSVCVYRIRAKSIKIMVDVNADKEYDETKIRAINKEEAIKLSKERKAKLIDVRNISEYESGHYEGAVNFPYQDLYLDTEKFLSDKNEHIILYCATGKRAFLTNRLLELKGYKNVWITDAYFN